MPNTRTPAPRRESPLSLASGADELNVAEFPLAVLGERPAGLKTLEFSDTVFDSGAGRWVTRRLTIAGSDKYGLPCAPDEDVLVTLLYLTKAGRFQSRTVHFSRYQVIKLLGWPDNGRSYGRLDDSLNRWLTVSLLYDNAWWDKRAKAWANPKFHILSEVNVLKGGRRPQDELPLSSFTWGETIFASFVAENLKGLDLEFYFRLGLAPAKRMYRFLDKRFGLKTRTWSFGLREFACEHIGFSRNYDTAQLKRKMRPSILELEQKGFLEPMADAERFPPGRKRGEASVVFERRRATAIPAAPKSVVPAPPLPRTPEQELVARGVTPATASRLAAAADPERLAQHLEVFDWMAENADPRVGRNPAGFLVKSIRDNYAPPKGFETKADRERKSRAAAEAERARRDEASEAKMKGEREDARRKAERVHVDQFLAALGPEDRREFEARALKAASEEDRRRASDGLFGDIMKRLLVEQQILRECPLVDA